MERTGPHRIVDYVAAYEERLAEPAPPWKHFPAVMVGWDNTARYSKSATVFEGATPDQYRRWLQRTVDSLANVRPEENYLFLLAWNEWAEGNHLEPDLRHGRAFLEVTRSVLLGSPSPGPAAHPSDPSATAAMEAEAGRAVRSSPTTVAGARAGRSPASQPVTMPAGPWLLVVGMHRSGTSAITGALGALGFETPGQADRMDWPESNPEHWESSALAVFDEEMLARSGGSWDAPPELPSEGRPDPAPGRIAEAVAAARAAYQAEGPLVWKDPRLCLLLPYWRQILPAPLAAVLVWRSPLAVARSLRTRDGLRSDPVWPSGSGTTATPWSTWLEWTPTSAVMKPCSKIPTRPSPPWPNGSLRSPSSPATPTGGSRNRQPPASATRPSRSRTGPEPDDGLLLAQHRELIAVLAGLEGGHRPLGPTRLMEESEWTTEILTARRGSRTRELDKLEAKRRTLEQELEDARRSVEQVRGSRAWRATEPLRALRARLGG